MSAEELVIYNRKQSVNAFQTQIIKQVIQYCDDNNLRHSTIYKHLSANGMKLERSNLSSLKAGRYQRQLSIYTLTAICEAVGLKLIDFIVFPEHLKKNDSSGASPSLPSVKSKRVK